MKRLRGNGGSRDLLNKEGIVLISSTYEKSKLMKLGGDTTTGDIWIVFTKN
jgi:hypothetical protein